VLCYLGAIGFIVVQDVWYSIKWREHMITYTTKVILSMTALVFVVGVTLQFFIEPSIRSQPFGPRLMSSAFQVMTASTTAGFNTIPIGPLTVNSYGMRQLVDALEKALKQLGGYEAQTRAIQIRNGKYNDNV
jgi:trk system potassium uptake protein TrkH